ncbi:murein biosynthesis integral membrane protein MurJ [Ornithinimicrobium sp. LYQ92]|uniref:murein biosynthesis integral membrane protein MurJ n=1 Tax=Serinicoccus sp. LYQ92 TaxID=3378798 RepID=UPI003853FDB2
MSGPSARIGSQGLVAAAGLVALVTLGARVAGVLRWLAFSHAVGATCVGQVYVTVNTVPNVLFEVAAGGALAAVAVPLISRQLGLGDEGRADRIASALLGWSLLVLLPLSLVAALAAGPISALLLTMSPEATGCVPQDARDAGALMLLLFAPQVLLYGLGIVLAGVLQAHRRFLTAALAPLLSSVVVIAVYLAFGAVFDATAPLSELPTGALVLLAGGTTLGVAALSLPLLVPISRLGVRWRPTLRFPAGSGRIAGALAVAGVAAVAAQQVFTVVVLLLTNVSGVGGITVWTYAQTVYLLPYAVLVVPLATAAFPRLTDDPGTAVPTLRRTVLAATVAAVAAAGALVAARREIGTVFLALDRGRDGAGRQALEALPGTLGALAPGLVGFALVAVLGRALYAAQRPREAAAGVVLGWAVAGLLPLLLVGSAPEVGQVLVLLAVGSSVGMTLAGGTLAVLTRRAWGAAAMRGWGRALGAALVGAVVATSAWELIPVDPQGWVSAVAWGVAAGAVVVAAVLAALAVLDRDAWSLVRGQVRARVGGRD